MMKSLPHRRSRIGATSVVAALAVAAAAFAAGSAFAADGHAHAKPAAAAQPAHDHGAGHGHDHAVDRLALDDGRKWPTDAALRDGMSRLRALTAKRIDAAHHGKLSTVQYAALARRVETEVGGIVANCKLEPRADAMLHLVIAELGAGADAMAGKAPGVKRVQGLLKVASAVNAYGEHFDHPGFEPIAELQH